MQDLEPEPGEAPLPVFTRRMLMTEMRKEMVFLLPEPFAVPVSWRIVLRAGSNYNVND